jgi:hypothetical protein
VQAIANRRWNLDRQFQSELRSKSQLDEAEWKKRYKRDAELQIVDQHLSMQSFSHYYDKMKDLNVPGF